MPQVVQCPECERQLRVPDDLLGRSVKCPSCGATFVAGPAPATPAEALPAEPALAEPVPDQPAAEPPRVRRRPPEDRYDDYAPDEGYEDDLGPGGRRGARERALSAVRGPGICLLVVGVLGLLGAGYLLVSSLLVDPQEIERAAQQQAAAQQRGRQMNAQQQAELEAMTKKITDVVIGGPAIVFHIVFMVVNVIILLGGVMMLLGRARWFGILASVLALLNVDCFCCVLGIPFGIWSLVALSRPDVKATFR